MKSGWARLRSFGQFTKTIVRIILSLALDLVTVFALLTLLTIFLYFW